MSKKSSKSKKVSAAKQPEASVPGTPAPEGLAVVAQFDRDKEKWFWQVREGKTEHHDSAEPFDSEESAKSAGEKWIAKYAKAKEAMRRKLLGFKKAEAANDTPTDGRALDEPRKAKKPKEPKEKKPSGLDAAAQVLKDAGEPMRCQDMVEKMLNSGLWKTNGKTPAATIYSAIHREIQTKKKESRFSKTDRGLFAYNADVPSATKEA